MRLVECQPSTKEAHDEDPQHRNPKAPVVRSKSCHPNHLPYTLLVLATVAELVYAQDLGSCKESLETPRKPRRFKALQIRKYRVGL